MARLDLNAYLAQTPDAAVVSWPIRVVGAVLFLLSVGAEAIALYTAFAHHQLRFALYSVALLPMVALIFRSVGYAVVHGRVPAMPLWPFASGKVAFAWVMTAFVVVRLFASDA